MNKILKLFFAYKKNSLKIAFLALIRFLICPFAKIDKLVSPEAKVVDVGCGEGVLANFLSISSPAREIIGIDLNPKKIQIANNAAGTKANIKFLPCDALKFDFSKIDFVLLSDVLHHLDYDKQRKLLQKIAQNPLTLIIKEIDKNDSWRFWLSSFYDHILYPKEKICFRSRAEWDKLLRDLGFTVKVTREKASFPGSTKLFICNIVK